MGYVFKTRLIFLSLGGLEELLTFHLHGHVFKRQAIYRISSSL